jgi:tetratricopeptide (TPR) repeat protein
MKKTWPFAALVLVCAAGGALASSYSDFNAGIAAHNRYDWDETIRRETAALGAPDLLPSFRVPAHIDRADAYLGKKEYDLALADYSAAIAIAPGNLQARLRRSVVYREKKNYAAAIADLNEMIRLRPTLTIGYVARAICNDEAGNLDAAIADYTTLIGFNAKDGGAYAARGSAWRRKGDTVKALADDSKALALEPRSPGVLFERAQAYQDQGDYTDAVTDITNGLRLYPSNADARLQLGLAQWEAGNFADATTAFGQVVQVRPDFPYAMIWRALSQSRTGQDYTTEFAASTAKLDMVKWPAPLVRLFQGQSTPDAALRAAANPDPEIAKQQTCEANFYAGEWDLMHGAQAAAIPLLQVARATCPYDFIERDAAIAELARTK